MNLTIVSNINSGIREVFNTDASKEEILYCVHVNDQRYDMIRQWDKNRIFNNVSWVRYHLERAGYSVTLGCDKKDKSELLVEVNEMEIIKESDQS